MKKIFVIAISALMASCFSPYYPEYVDIISLGANTDTIVCENGEGEVSLSILSNVEYTATLETGTEWLRFADTESAVRVGNGNESIDFVHMANNHDKRVANLVIEAGNVKRLVRIKQKGHFEDFLELHPEDLAGKFTGSDGRMPIAVNGEKVALRLKTSCLDHEITCTVDHATAISDIKIDNRVLSFSVAENEEGMPRIINFTLSYVDGWDDTKTLAFALKQAYKPE